MQKSMTCMLDRLWRSGHFTQRFQQGRCARLCTQVQDTLLKLTSCALVLQVYPSFFSQDAQDVTRSEELAMEFSSTGRLLLRETLYKTNYWPVWNTGNVRQELSNFEDPIRYYSYVQMQQAHLLSKANTEVLHLALYETDCLSFG